MGREGRRKRGEKERGRGRERERGRKRKGGREREGERSQLKRTVCAATFPASFLEYTASNHKHTAARKDLVTRTICAGTHQTKISEVRLETEGTLPQ